MRETGDGVLELSICGLGVNSLSWHVEVERDDLTSCSQVMVELWTRKREIGDGYGGRYGR